MITNPFEAPAQKPEADNSELGAELRWLMEVLLFAVPMGTAPVMTWFCVGSYVEARTHYLSAESFGAATLASVVVAIVVSALEFGAYRWQRRHNDL